MNLPMRFPSLLTAVLLPALGCMSCGKVEREDPPPTPTPKAAPTPSLLQESLQDPTPVPGATPKTTSWLDDKLDDAATKLDQPKLDGPKLQPTKSGTPRK